MAIFKVVHNFSWVEVMKQTQEKETSRPFCTSQLKYYQTFRGAQQYCH